MTWFQHSSIILMMIAASVLAVLFMLIRVTVGARSVEGGVLAMFSKALASVGFIMIGMMCLYIGVVNTQSAVFVLFGLVMGLVGDIVLDLKVVYEKSREEGIYLTGGMASFGIGHIFFFIGILLMLPKTVVTPLLIVICCAMSLGISAAIMLVGKYVLKFDFGKFIIHSAIYAFMLVFMVVFSVACYLLTKDRRLIQFMVGMILFLVSDIVLTQMYFGGKSKDKLLCIINHTAYYAAQICIASFICLL